MATLEEIQRRAAELRKSAGATTPADISASSGGRLVASTEEPQDEPGAVSRFAGAAASGFRRLVPQEARDVAGAVGRFATSGEYALNTLGQVAGNEDLGTDIRSKIEEVPVVGGALGTAFDVAAAPATLLTAGAGSAAAGALRGAGTAGKVAASLLAPVSSSPNVGARLLSETILGTGGMLASEEAAKRDAPLAVQIAAGALGGVAALGVAGMARGAAGTFSRNSAQVAAQQYGHNIGARTFIPDLLPADVVKAEIKTSADPLERGVLGNRLIDPTRTMDSDIGKNWNVFTRQVRRGDQLAELAAGAALDPHARGAGMAAGGGGQLFDITDTGTVNNLRGLRGDGESLNWYDVFSAPDAAKRYGFTAEQTAYWKDWHQAKDEMADMLVANGVVQSRKQAEEALYVPRIVREVGDAEIHRNTNHQVQRVFEEAREGVARGIKYENDPKAVLQTYLRAGYKAVAEKQLDDLMATSGNLVTAKQALARTKPEVITRVETAAKALKEAQRANRSQRSLVPGTRARIDVELLRDQKILGRAEAALARAEQAAKDNAKRMKRDTPAAGLQGRVDAARARVDEFRTKIAQTEDARKNLPKVRAAEGPALTPASAAMVRAAQTEWHAAKAAYSRALDGIQRAEVLPGSVFGNAQHTIRVGHWKGKFLPEDADYLKLAEHVNTLTGRALPAKLDPFSKTTQDFANVVRFASATGDMAMPFIQGLPLLGQNPVLWAKMAYAHYRAALDPSFGGRYLRDRLATLQEMAQHGIPVGDVEQFAAVSGTGMASLIRKGAATRAGKQTVGRLQAAYDVGLTSSRVQLWEALKPVWDGSVDDLARYVRNMTGGLDSASIGIPPTQRAIESVWLGFSPRLMRSTLALVGMAANPNSPAGRQAARSLLGLAAFATTALTTANIGIGLASGESEEQIRDRVKASLDPLAGKRFLSMNINGQNIGVGGQVRAITQFVANATTNPGGFATANAYENPLVAFYLSRGAVGVNLAGTLIEGATGERVNALPYEQIDSLPDAVMSLGTSFLPFVVQAQLEADSLSAIERAQLATLGFAGTNVNEDSPTDEINKVSAERYDGRPFGELTGTEQQALETEFADLFTRRDERRKETGGRDERNRRAALQAIDDNRVGSERALVDARDRGLLTPDQFREEMKTLQRIAAESKRPFISDFESEPDANRDALTAWYATFDQAKVAGTDVVDWDQHAVLERALFDSLTADQKRYIEQRRKAEHADEAVPFFDAEKRISNSAYYDTIDAAFELVRGSLPSEINSYSALVLAANRARQAGDAATFAFLSRIQTRADAIASRQKRALRLSDPQLDADLVATGRVSRSAR